MSFIRCASVTAGVRRHNVVVDWANAHLAFLAASPDSTSEFRAPIGCAASLNRIDPDLLMDRQLFGSYPEKRETADPSVRRPSIPIVINIRTTKALDIEMPTAKLLRADEVIE
jgi:hypothetical protein